MLLQLELATLVSLLAFFAIWVPLLQGRDIRDIRYGLGSRCLHGPHSGQRQRLSGAYLQGRILVVEDVGA